MGTGRLPGRGLSVKLVRLRRLDGRATRARGDDACTVRALLIYER